MSDERVLTAIRELGDKVASLEKKLDVSLKHMCASRFEQRCNPVAPGTFRPCFAPQVRPRGRQTLQDPADAV
jgi:hypothetical protein